MESHDVRAMAQDICCLVFQAVNVIGHAYENGQRRGSKTKLDVMIDTLRKHRDAGIGVKRYK
jgi:hypothetical protein